MITIANLTELMQLIREEHSDPHHILGMHIAYLDDKKVIAVRTFLPQAQKVDLIDLDDNISHNMHKIHEDGVFEIIIHNKRDFFKYKFRAQNYEGTFWEFYDAYCYRNIIGDFDIYLFGEGTNYKIYEKLGAHTMTIDNIEGTFFSIWAPNARQVSVIGSFNCWDSRRHLMRNMGESGIWEIFIPGVYELEKYKFKIKGYDGHSFEKCDPYGNFFELRPSTSCLVYDINKYSWNDSDWMDSRYNSCFEKKPVNIYELHLGSFMRNCEENNRFLSYVELVDNLIPYVVEMNYTHIEIMPIMEHPFDASWGYQVTGYFAPTSRYGKPDEFMYFVDKCHENNIGVILDWVPAHFPKDAHGLTQMDSTCLYEHFDKSQGEHPHWGTLIFNYGRKEVKNFLISNAIFWIEKYHLDGLRVDAVASMLYLDYGKDDGKWTPNKYGGRENEEAVEFLKHMNSIIEKLYPGILIIAEESTSWPAITKKVNNDGIGFNLKWDMGWMNDFLSYISKETVHRKYHHNDLTFSMVYFYSEKFMLVLSHDEVVHGKNSLINKMPGDTWQKFANLRASYGFMYGHPGKKLSFMGNEFAQYDEWNENKSLDWHLMDIEYNKKFHNFVKKLNLLYLKESAFWYSDFDYCGFGWIDCDDNEHSIISFYRRGIDDNDILIFVCNFTEKPYFDLRVGVPVDCEYKEILNSDDVEYGGSGIKNDQKINCQKVPYNYKNFSIKINLPPLAVVILKPIR